MKLNLNIRFYFLVLLAGVLVFSSCHTTRRLHRAEVMPITTAGLLSKIEQNAFDFEYFTVRRINCQFSDNNSKTSFTATLRAQKDKAILVSISKLSVTVGSVMLTPDSVKYINYLERNYFLEDYTSINKILNVELDFETIQAVLFNSAFLYRKYNFRNVKTLVEDGFYVLAFENKEPYIETRRMFFDPTIFALTRLMIDDKTNNQKIEFTFADFEKIQETNYPSSIDMYFTSPDSKVSLSLKMNGFSNEIINSFSLNIPDRYERIRIN